MSPEVIQQREVAFHDELVNSGAMRGRQLEVDKDYDRGFIKVAPGMAKTIDEGLTIAHDNFPNLFACISTKFKKEDRNLVLESIKASSAVKLARQYISMGKKVVIFHQAMRDPKKLEIFKPDRKTAQQLEQSGKISSADAVFAEYSVFKEQYPEFANLRLDKILSPLQTFQNEFGDKALYINGKQSNTAKQLAQKSFNDDNSGKRIIIVQQDAGNAGISLHDTTGKYQRVLINIGIPVRPSYAMQIEGRIYHTGNASNAIFRYLSTDTNLEKNLFAETIGSRSQTVENLSLGSLARGLRNSFTTLYEELSNDTWKRRNPGHPEEGTGGKKADTVEFGIRARWSRAIQLFTARMTRKVKENANTFQTPEPIGLKMVEWLGLKSGERALEPSAGFGAISRWLSPNTKNTVIETDGTRAATAKLLTPSAKVITGKFEDYNIINKYDGIVMAPPADKKTAIAHIQKAVKHLADGGRLVVFTPRMLDSRYKHDIDSYFYTNADSQLQKRANIRINIDFNGDTEPFTIEIFDKYTDSKLKNKASKNQITEDLRQYTDAEELFGKLQDLTVPPRLEVKKESTETSSKQGEVDTRIDNIVEEKDLTSAQKLLKSFVEKLGVKTVFFSNKDGNFHGAHAGNTSYINVNSKMPHGKVFWHESMHWLKNNNSDLFDEFAKAAQLADSC